MFVIEFKQKGDFRKLDKYFERLKEKAKIGVLDKYGKAGVAALSESTPVRTGLTASSWYYKIKRQNGKVSLEFYNSNVNEGAPIAILLQYGHATSSGGWVQGVDYINPALKPIFDRIANDAWNEIRRL